MVLIPFNQRIIYLFIGMVFLAGCSNVQQKKTEIKEDMPVDKATKKPASSFGDTLLIEKASAVFFHPDSIQVARYKEAAKKMPYATSEHDCFYQMRNARNVLRKNWPKINIVECMNYRYVLFIKEDKTKVYIDLDSLDICGLLIFDRQKDPQLADMMNIDTQLESYFKQQKRAD
jgi:hypothetical protein